MPLNNIETLINIPTKMELDAFINECNRKGMHDESVSLGILNLNKFIELGTGAPWEDLGKYNLQSRLNIASAD